MPENDPGGLADQLEAEARDLQRSGEQLQDEIDSTRKDWEQKRGDPHVPGAVPERQGEADEQSAKSPAPQAPPENEEPSAATTAPEGSAGPPSDTLDEDHGQRS